MDAKPKIQILNCFLKVGLKEDMFKPRQEIIEVDLQRRNEKKLLDFIEKKFVIDMMKARQEHVILEWSLRGLLVVQDFCFWAV